MDLELQLDLIQAFDLYVELVRMLLVFKPLKGIPPPLLPLPLLVGLLLNLYLLLDLELMARPGVIDSPRCHAINDQAVGERCASKCFLHV